MGESRAQDFGQFYLELFLLIHMVSTVVDDTEQCGSF